MKSLRLNGSDALIGSPPNLKKDIISWDLSW